MFLGLAVFAPGIVIVPAVAHEVCNHMAQTTIPVYLTGKVGSIVYTPNRQGTAVRQLVTPKNPSTAGQTAQRQRFSAAAKAWAGPRSPPRKPRGRRSPRLWPTTWFSFNAYVRVNITCQEVGTTPPTTAPVASPSRQCHSAPIHCYGQRAVSLRSPSLPLRVLLPITTCIVVRPEVRRRQRRAAVRHHPHQPGCYTRQRHCVGHGLGRTNTALPLPARKRSYRSRPSSPASRAPSRPSPPCSPAAVNAQLPFPYMNM